MICHLDCGALGLGSHNDVIVRERASCLRAVPSGNGLRQSGVVLSWIHDAALKGPLFHGSATEALSRKQIRSRAFEWFGAEAEDVSVRIFDVKLQRPIVIGERHADGDSAGDKFVVQPGGILDADPDPGRAASLSAAAQIDARTVAVDGRELVRAPTRILKAQLVDVEGERGLHVLHAKDWRAVFEVDAG